MSVVMTADATRNLLMFTPIHWIDGAKRRSALAAGLQAGRPRMASSVHSAAVGGTPIPAQ
jgi:hypothetical protein